MAALHTWAGVVLGGLLFAVFWMGTLSVFDREIDRWLMPATRVPALSAPGSLDARVQQLQQLAPGQQSFSLQPPNARVPVWQLRWEEHGKNVLRHVDRTLTDAEANLLRDRIYAAVHEGTAPLLASPA